MLESKVQSNVIKMWRRCGWKCIKMETPTEKSWPDFMCLNSGRCVFIEFKKEGEEPTAQQLIRHQEIMDQGFEVYVIDRYQDGLELLRSYTGYCSQAVEIRGRYRSRGRK